MTGQALTYLLSFLLPLSPMLCGHCQRSNLPGPNYNCCSSHCPEQSTKKITADPSGENGLVARPDCQIRQQACTHPRPCPTRFGCWEPDHCELRNHQLPQPEPGPSQPCRPEHCRSAVCAHSAIVLRPLLEWTTDAIARTLALTEPIDNALFDPLTLTTSQAFVCSQPCGRPVNVGPSGRAARIAYDSWLI